MEGADESTELMRLSCTVPLLTSSNLDQGIKMTALAIEPTLLGRCWHLFVVNLFSTGDHRIDL